MNALVEETIAKAERAAAKAAKAAQTAASDEG
jgi:hypothetical protein